MADDAQTRTFIDDRIMKVWAEQERVRKQEMEEAQRTEENRRRRRERRACNGEQEQQQRAALPLERESLVATCSSISSSHRHLGNRDSDSMLHLPEVAHASRSSHPSDNIPTYPDAARPDSPGIVFIEPPSATSWQSASQPPSRPISNNAHATMQGSTHQSIIDVEFDEDDATYVYVPPASLARHITSQMGTQQQTQSPEADQGNTRVYSLGEVCRAQSVIHPSADDPDQRFIVSTSINTANPYQPSHSAFPSHPQHSERSASSRYPRMPWAGRGWISPHPLSEATSSWISIPQSHVIICDSHGEVCRKLTYDEWLALPSIDDEIAFMSSDATNPLLCSSTTSNEWSLESQRLGRAPTTSPLSRESSAEIVISNGEALSTHTSTAASRSRGGDNYIHSNSITRQPTNLEPRQPSVRARSMPHNGGVTTVNGCEFIRLQMPWDAPRADTGRGATW